MISNRRRREKLTKKIDIMLQFFFHPFVWKWYSVFLHKSVFLKKMYQWRWLGNWIFLSYCIFYNLIWIFLIGKMIQFYNFRVLGMGGVSVRVCMWGYVCLPLNVREQWKRNCRFEICICPKWCSIYANMTEL